MRRLDQVIAWLIVLLGVRSGLTAPRVFAATAAPWPIAFFLLSTCLLLAVCGTLNLLRNRYAAVAPGVRIVSTMTNIAVAALLLIAGVIGGELAPSVVEALILLTAAAFGFRR